MLKSSFIWFVLMYIYTYRESPVSLIFIFFSLFLVNDPEALKLNLACLKFISGMNLSPVHKSFFTTSFTLYLQNKRGLNKEIWIKDAFISKVVSNPLACCYLINPNFLILHTAHCDKIISFSLFVVAAFGFLMSVFFLYT